MGLLKLKLHIVTMFSDLLTVGCYFKCDKTAIESVKSSSEVRIRRKSSSMPARVVELEGIPCLSGGT